MFNFLKILKLKILLPCLRDYKIIKKLGEGTYGLTYLIEDHNSNKYVFKHLKKKASKKAGSQIKYEMSILSQLNHPNIPKLLYIIDNHGEVFSLSNFKKVKVPIGYIIEYVEGKTLAQLLYNEDYKFSNQEVWQIAKQLVDIIAYLQENNIIHRDIRTPNVIKTEDNKICLLDFGLARPISKKEDYEYDLDFVGLADFLLYLLYSNFDLEESDKAWYEELDLSKIEKDILKRMFGINEVYKDVYELKDDIEKINLVA